MLTEILVPIAIFAVVFGIVFVVVTARNRERMAMIEKGVDPKSFVKETGNKYNILKWALLIIGLGIGAVVGNLLATYTDLSDEASYFGPILIFGGLGLLIAFLIIKKSNGND